MIIIIIPWLSNSGYTQVDTTQKDSSRIYQKIESLAKKSKFSDALYQIIFVSQDDYSRKNNYMNDKNGFYKNAEGKIIRSINILTYDPFGYLSTDIPRSNENKITRMANRLHIKTNRRVVKNLLLFKENDAFDSLSVKESERLIRQRSFVRQVAIVPELVSPESDSVDITVWEVDSWSIIPTLSFPKDGTSFELTDQNLVGLGHELSGGISSNTFQSSYNINNFRNTYINATAFYRLDAYNNRHCGILIDRPFFSPLTKWAGGIQIGSEILRESYKLKDSLPSYANKSYNTMDYWAGYSRRLNASNINVNNRITNFIFTLRHLRQRSAWNMTNSLIGLYPAEKEDFTIAQFGVSKRKYIRSRYIFNYGFIEDVPVGFEVAAVIGWQQKNEVSRPYLGMKISAGQFFRIGHLSAQLDYGSFFQKSGFQEGVLSTGLTYFTNIIELGKIKLRQFAKVQTSFGLNRSPNEYLSLNQFYRIGETQNPSLQGYNRVLLTLQTQSYLPWSILGFRFGPYAVYSLGLIGGNSNKPFDMKGFSQFGLGILVRNINLVINTFQVSVAFFPYLPGSEEGILQFNPIRSNDFGFRDFGIGKPFIADYK